jgi:hypothetical protein
MFVVFYMLKSLGTRKKKEMMFCKEEDQENNSWTPLLFPSPSLSPYAFLFLNNNLK